MLGFRNEKQDRVYALILTVAYLAIGLSVLFWGHPHEDAFILFRYVKNVVAGHGIVYYPGGPHAEGATDFLWMVAVAAVHSTGVDVALSALLLNAAGFYLSTRLLIRALPSSWPFRLAVFLQLASPLALAGYLGFGVTLYSGVALALLVLYIEGRILFIPAVALLLGLLRPDGVIPGALFAFLGLLDAKRIGLLRRYLVVSLACIFLGAAYFAWRWQYFGSLLPLPLYVKRHYWGSPPGIAETFDWFLACGLPLVLVAIAGPWLVGRSETPARRLLLGLVPFAVHVASFAPSVQSQNIANRFQAPATLALVFVAFSLVGAKATSARRIGFAAVVFGAFLPLIPIAKAAADDAFEHRYMNRFAHDLGAVLPPTRRIAVTEAGRLPFWTAAPTLDLVGLNSPETARTPPNADLFARFDPDLVMVHPAGSLDENRLDDGSGRSIVPIAFPIREAVVPGIRHFLLPSLPDYRDIRAENVHVAPVATWAVLSDNPHYDFYAVRFKSRFARFHVYAIRRDLPEKETILELLRTAHTEPSQGYWALRK